MVESQGGWAGKTVLVTGATGFIGTALCHRLACDGAQVHAMARHAGEPRAGITAVQADASDYDRVERVMRQVKPHTVFHLAGYVTGVRDAQAVLPALQSNTVGTVNVLQAAMEHHCKRFVLASSMEEPEIGAGAEPPSSPYAASKQAATSFARMYHQIYDFPVTIARIFMAYGPGQADPRRLIPHVIYSLLQGKEPKLGAGDRQVDWIYIDDVVEGLLACGIRGGLNGKQVDIGTGQTILLRDLVRRIYAQMAPGREPRFGALPARAFEQVRVADQEEAFRVTGWKPKVSLDEGLRRMIASLREASSDAETVLS